MEKDSKLDSYLAACAVVQRRVGLVALARWIQRSHWVVGIMGLIVAVVLRRSFEWRGYEVWVVAALLGFWFAWGAALALFSRPDPMRSLIILDRKGGWKDQFASAWAFLKAGSEGAGEHLHITKASRAIDRAVAEFPGAMPLPRLGLAWILPVLALLFAASPLWRVPLGAGEMMLTNEMVEEAGIQAEAIAREANRVVGLEALKDTEKVELENLRVDVNGLAETLADAEGLTAGEMLEALESRARAVDRLAEKLAASSDEWASQSMIDEMTRYSDTADLAIAIREKASEPAVSEAMAIQRTLDNTEISRETSQRYATTLENIMHKAEEEDRFRAVGERVGNASIKMSNQQPRTAAREFEALAKHFQLMSKREAARKKLDELASVLREAGSEVSGTELKRMEQLEAGNQIARETPEGLQSLDADPLASQLKELMAPHLAENGGDKADENRTPGGGDAPSEAPIPGIAESKQPQPGEGGDASQLLKAPVPGEGPPSGENGSVVGASEKGMGEQQGASSQMQAPVPGMNPADSASGAGMSSSGSKSGQAGQGGNEAGSGTAELVDTQSDLMKAAKESRVDAQVNTEGGSSVRAVEGQVRQEGSASRSRQEIITEYLSVEEQALDGKSLPLSRRDHVIRYFSAIRGQFEEESKNP